MRKRSFSFGWGTGDSFESRQKPSKFWGGGGLGGVQRMGGALDRGAWE